MTMSPSQFGRRMTTLWACVHATSPTESAFLVCRGREHARDRRGGGLEIAPAAVHPQPEIRIPPHVHLEDVGAPLREVAHDRLRVVGGSACGGSTGVLVDRSGIGRRAAAARTRGSPARPSAAPAPRAPTSSAAGRLKKSTVTASALWMC